MSNQQQEQEQDLTPVMQELMRQMTRMQTELANLKERAQALPTATTPTLAKTPSTLTGSRRKTLKRLGLALLGGAAAATVTGFSVSEAKVIVNPVLGSGTTTSKAGAIVIPPGAAAPTGNPPSNGVYYGLIASGSPSALDLSTLPPFDTGVYATAATYGVSGYSTGSSGVNGQSSNAAGVYGYSTSNVGVYGQSSNGKGVYGYSTNGGIGVYGQSSGAEGVAGFSTSNAGVYGQSSSGSGVSGASSTGYGIVGYSTSNAGVSGGSSTNYGVSGGSSSGYGVFGSSSTSVGVSGFSTSNYGVYGYSSSSSGIGVYGTNAAGFGGSGYAGYFLGDVHVNATLSKASGSFKIDHPLDPSNKYLYHSFVESPDMLNIYNGNVTLDNKGEAIVELPGWFEALNSDFRYQLTCLGEFAPVFIAEKINNRRFKIAGGKSGQEVSWQVTGIRQDEWAKAHRIPVEVEKTGDEKGKYLHPELFGEPEEKSVSPRPPQRPGK